jgi:hypothetical protein
MPAATHTMLPDASQPHWFGQSHRLIGGQPDTRYGWLDTPQGACIVKELNRDLAAYADTLLGHERFMLERMAERGAPVCEWLPHSRPDWLVTRFAGLSLRRLAQSVRLKDGSQGPALSPLEHLSVWVHLLRRIEPMAAQGILMVDLHEGNVTLPLLEQGGLAGQLALQRPCLIDHAHSLVSEASLQRPLLIDPGSAYIAPELRTALDADLRDLEAHFALHGYSRLPQQSDSYSPALWAQYNHAPQVLGLVQSGRVCAARAMQFSAGQALSRRLAQGIEAGARPQLRQVVQRMQAAEPAQRYGSLAEAAQALADCLPALAVVSTAHLDRVVPEHLIALPAGEQVFIDPLSPTQFSKSWADTTVEAIPADHTVHVGAPQHGRKTLLADLPNWFYTVVALSAALGTYLAR